MQNNRRWYYPWRDLSWLDFTLRDLTWPSVTWLSVAMESLTSNALSTLFDLIIIVISIIIFGFHPHRFSQYKFWPENLHTQKNGFKKGQFWQRWKKWYPPFKTDFKLISLRTFLGPVIIKTASDMCKPPPLNQRSNNPIKVTPTTLISFR